MCYPARITQNAGGKDWVTKFPDLAGSNTGGATEDEALEEAADCLGSYLAKLMADHKPIPDPRPARKGERLIPVPLWLAPKLALYRALREGGVSNSALARRMGVRETIIRRMLDPDQATKPERLETALRIMGKQLRVTIADAA